MVGSDYLMKQVSFQDRLFLILIPKTLQSSTTPIINFSKLFTLFLWKLWTAQ